jgi:hypothetical protein
MIAAWLRGELSGAVVQLIGLRSARVQDFYAVSMQVSLCASRYRDKFDTGNRPVRLPRAKS